MIILECLTVGNPFLFADWLSTFKYL